MLKNPAISARLAAAVPVQAGFFASQFHGKDGVIQIDDLTGAFGISKSQLAETIGVKPETLQRSARVAAPKTQTRLREMLEILARVNAWAGGEIQAMAWYRAQPIPAFGGRTAEALVKAGEAGAVRDWLDLVATGGFA